MLIFFQVISRGGAANIRKPSSGSTSTTSSFLGGGGSQKNSKSSLGGGLNSSNDENDLSAANTSNGSSNSNHDDVQLRPKTKQHCKVLFSYTPTHEDELELNPDDIIEFQGEVEDGWWRGITAQGKTGVFPSNFVEMMAAAQSNAVDKDKDKEPAPAALQQQELAPKVVEARNPVLGGVVAAENKKNNENSQQQKGESRRN